MCADDFDAFDILLTSTKKIVLFIFVGTAQPVILSTLVRHFNCEWWLIKNWNKCFSLYTDGNNLNESWRDTNQLILLSVTQRWESRNYFGAKLCLSNEKWAFIEESIVPENELKKKHIYIFKLCRLLMTIQFVWYIYKIGLFAIHCRNLSK